MKPTTTATEATTKAADLLTPSVDNLPAVITQQVQRPGDLIDTSGFTAAEVEQARKIAGSFNFSNTADILTFAADPQKEISAFLDELLGDIRVKDAGIAGDMSMQMASGIDLMQLGKVRNQIENPPGNGIISRIIQFLTGWKNYIEAFFNAQRPVRDLIRKIEKSAENRITTLNGHSAKLDLLTEKSGIQVKKLAVWIAAGEAILLEGIKQYSEKREKVLQNNDPLEATQLRDDARQIAAFEKRLLETKIAYIEAGSVTIPRIRIVQEAIVIEIQNISEQILFQIPKFKNAIVQIAALHDVAEAQRQRDIMDENERNLDEAMGGLANTIYTKSKESQGSPLEKVQALEVVINDMKTGIEGSISLEEATREKRQEAEQILLSLRDVVSNALKGADLEAA